MGCMIWPIERSIWWGKTYHPLEDFGYFAHCKLYSQTYSLFLLTLSVLVLVLDLLQQLLGFLLVGASPQAGVTGEFAVFVDYAQAYDLVAIFDQFLDEPLYGVVGVVIVIGAAKKGSGSLSVLIVLVFGGYVEGIISCIAVIEGVEGDAALVFPCKTLVSEAHRVPKEYIHDALATEWRGRFDILTCTIGSNRRCRLTIDARDDCAK